MHDGNTPATRPSVAVIGSGVSGLTAAYLLRETHDVTLLEADDRLGGHAHTHQVAAAAGATMGVDSGFIVHNDRTYPHLRRLFDELGVEVHPTEMSMSIQCTRTGLEYAGGRGAKGIFAQRRRVADPRFLGLLAQVKRFQVLAGKLLDDPAGDDTLTYGEFLRQHRFGAYFTSYYAIPVVSCVWSSGHDVALEYPARYLFEFLRHHGFLSLGDSPQWFTVVGGSGTYVEKVAAALGDVRRSTGATRVVRDLDGVTVDDVRGGSQRYDQVVLATHADDALALLADPTPDEKRVLGAFEYSHNETVLHTDASLLPTAPQARAAWNYRTDGGRREARTQVTYWMNRLQGLPGDEQFLVTLNATDRIDPARVVATMQYTHPIYTPASVAAQRDLDSLTTGRTAFAGAYHGWGFHEDGCRSGVRAAAAVGGTRW
ncbi:MAG: FAD-dependent oxidoreductase [Nocardioidaceae bacterium]|nr:FAD-dependent oxidoreductase [Nocardioidaceae bacterium]